MSYTERIEDSMKKIQWAAGIILASSVIVILLISSFEIAMYSDFGVYEREYEKYNVLNDLDMTMEDTMHVTREMMAYLRGDREELSVVTTVEGVEQDFFNKQDRFHMAEVKDLFIGGLNLRTGACVLAVLCLIALILLKADWRKVIPKSYWIALWIIGVLLVLFAAAAAIDFNAVFVAFHHVFFDNDLWLFDPAEDYMIRMLPEGLFADMVVRIGLLFAGGLLAVFVLSLIPGRMRKKAKN